MPAIGSPFHAIAYRLPEGEKRPHIIIDALHAIERALHGRGALGTLIGRIGVRGKPTRKRAVRSDSRTNRCALLSAIIAHTDITTGIVVSESPTNLPDGLRFLVPMSVATLTKKAYGDLIAGEISTARVVRGLMELKSLGLIDLTPQFERLSNGDILNMPSVKAVTTRFWEVVRLWDKLVKVRGARAAEKSVQRLQAILAGVARREGRKRAERALHGTRGAITGTPESRAAAAAYRKRAASLGLTGAALERSVKAYMARWRG